MDLRDPLVLNLGRLNSREALKKPTFLKMRENGSKAIRGLRVASPHIMLEVVRMVNEPGARHDIEPYAFSDPLSVRNCQQSALSLQGLGSRLSAPF